MNALAPLRLDYERPRARSRPGRWQWLAVGGVVAWGWFFMAYFRTMDWGFSPRAFLASLAFGAFLVGVPAAACLFGRDRRTVLTWSVLAVLASALLAEGWAAAQEQRFAWKCRQRPGVAAWESRWWPFPDHHIGYYPGSGYFGND